MQFFFTFLILVTLATAEGVFDYQVPVMDASRSAATLAGYKGKPFFLLYFSMDCGKCKKALADLSAFIKRKPGVAIVGVVTGANKEADFLALKPGEYGFAVYYDKKKSFRNKYSLDLTPTTLFVDKDGKILGVKQGNYPELLGVYDAILTGRTSAFLKTIQSRYYGAEFCEPCHAKIFDAWKTTGHAMAYDPIAKKLPPKNGFSGRLVSEGDCLPCHTLGYGEPTGYDEAQHQKRLMGVQCESCHLGGGPHAGRRVTDYEAICLRCHNSEQDPLFRYSASLKKIKHP